MVYISCMFPVIFNYPFLCSLFWYEQCNLSVYFLLKYLHYDRYNSRITDLRTDKSNVLFDSSFSLSDSYSVFLPPLYKPLCNRIFLYVNTKEHYSSYIKLSIFLAICFKIAFKDNKNSINVMSMNLHRNKNGKNVLKGA